MKRRKILVYVLFLLAFALHAEKSYAQCFPELQSSHTWWPLNETSGTIAFDQISSINAVYFGTSSVPGQVLEGRLFDGIDDYIGTFIPGAIAMGSGDFSLDFWINPNPSAASQPIISQTDGTNGFALHYADGILVFDLLASSSPIPVTLAATIPQSTWTHVAVSVDRDNASGLKLYVNGSLADTQDPTSHQGDITANVNLTFGAAPEIFPGFFSGMLDEVSIYLGVLSGSELQGIYNANTLGRCLVGSCPNLSSIDRNLRKYWRYKERLKSAFMVTASGALGQPNCALDLPAAERSADTWIEGTGGLPSLLFGDTTLELGYYLGVLATEYRLLANAGQNTDETVEDLARALAAFNRLDDYAEPAWAEFLNTQQFLTCQGTVNRNGFFLRNDIGDGLLFPTHANDLNSEVGRYAQFQVDVTLPHNRPSEESQDQAYGILVGLALIAKLVDTNEQFQGMMVNAEAEAIADRIVSWMKQDSWTIKNPVRNKCVWGISSCFDTPPKDLAQELKCCSDGGAITFPFSFGIAEAGNKIANDFPADITAPFGTGYHDTLSSVASLPTWTSINTFNFLDDDNVRMLMELGAVNDAMVTGGLGNVTKTYLGKLAEEFHYEHLPLVHHQLYEQGHDLDKDRLQCLLDTAPCSGPFGTLNGTTGPYEWNMSNRLYLPRRRGDATSFGNQREFAGIDYMFLYNLFHLTYSNELPAYQRLFVGSNMSCDYCDAANDTTPTNCDCDDQIGDTPSFLNFCRRVEGECKKVCRRVKGRCVKTCKEEKKECKTTCLGDKTTCYGMCIGLTGSARKECRRDCRQVKRDCKSGCRQTKRTCKTTCRNDKTLCKNQCVADRIQCDAIAAFGTEGDQRTYCESFSP